MDASWTLANGHPRVDATVNDFLFPYPYPPLYLAVNGTLLRIFGNDLAVGRALGAATALGIAALLVWIGRRLRDRSFGFLCAAAFLVYPEAVTNFRWARGHTLCGLFVTASIGFLVRYVQEKRLRDVLFAGAMCSLAIATTYWSWGLVGAVLLTALFVEKKHAPAALLASLGYLILFLLAYGLFHAGGFEHLKTQFDRLSQLANGTSQPPIWEQAWSLVTFLFWTPVSAPSASGSAGEMKDLWLIAGAVGLALVPARRFRRWLVLWLIVVAFAVARRRGSTLSTFMYPAMVFLPLLAIGFAGSAAWIAEKGRAWISPRGGWIPGIGALAVYACISLTGSIGHFRTKIDSWTQRSVADAEKAMEFVNARTGPDDFVVVPKQIYWLVKHERKAMLAFCVNYDGQANDIAPVLIPHDEFWFDCRWQNAKFAVIAAGQDANGPYGFDAVAAATVPPIRAALEAITQGPAAWPLALATGEYKVFANPRFAGPGPR